MKKSTPRSLNIAQRDPDATKRYVIVTRLSKASANSVSHETQEAVCRNKIAAMGGVVAGVYHDDDISGDRLERPGLKAAIAMIAANDADVLMVHSIDRAARDQIGLM